MEAHNTQRSPWRETADWLEENEIDPSDIRTDFGGPESEEPLVMGIVGLPGTPTGASIGQIHLARLKQQGLLDLYIDIMDARFNEERKKLGLEPQPPLAER